MKRSAALIFLMLVFLPFCLAQDSAIESSNFVDYIKTLNLTPLQRDKILQIQKEEKTVLEPLALNYAAKQRGVELLETMKCKTFDFNCKQMLKEDINTRKFERREALYKIQQKQNYYMLRYRSVLTRAQDLKLQELQEENKFKQKVLEEREAKAKKQSIIEKLRF